MGSSMCCAEFVNEFCVVEVCIKGGRAGLCKRQIHKEIDADQRDMVGASWSARSEVIINQQYFLTSEEINPWILS